MAQTLIDRITMYPEICHGKPTILQMVEV